jgi:hypothetical protein
MMRISKWILIVGGSCFLEEVFAISMDNMRPDVKSNLVKFQNNTMRAEQNNVYCM